MKTAKLLKDVSKDFTGSAGFYKLSEPIEWSEYDFEKEESISHKTSFVVVSATIAMFTGAETYIFPADKDGNIVDYGELEGSYRGGLDQKAALEGAGFSVK